MNRRVGMRQLITTSKCYDCGELMEGRVENYKYVESGLSSVELKNILVFRCSHCGGVMPQITAAVQLHARIAMHLLSKKTRLRGEEIRFLRKAVGYSATHLAKMVGTSKSIVSRWENHSTTSQENDRLIRLICLNKMLSDCLLGSSPSDIPEDFVGKAQEMLASMDETLIKLRKKKSAKREHFAIDPAELGRLGSGASEESPEQPVVQ